MTQRVSNFSCFHPLANSAENLAQLSHFTPKALARDGAAAHSVQAMSKGSIYAIRTGRDKSPPCMERLERTIDVISRHFRDSNSGEFAVSKDEQTRILRAAFGLTPLEAPPGHSIHPSDPDWPDGLGHDLDELSKNQGWFTRPVTRSSVTIAAYLYMRTTNPPLARISDNDARNFRTWLANTLNGNTPGINGSIDVSDLEDLIEDSYFTKLSLDRANNPGCFTLHNLKRVSTHMPPDGVVDLTALHKAVSDLQLLVGNLQLDSHPSVDAAKQAVLSALDNFAELYTHDTDDYQSYRHNIIKFIASELPEDTFRDEVIYSLLQSMCWHFDNDAIADTRRMDAFRKDFEPHYGNCKDSAKINECLDRYRLRPSGRIAQRKAETLTQLGDRDQNRNRISAALGCTVETCDEVLRIHLSSLDQMIGEEPGLNDSRAQSASTVKLNELCEAADAHMQIDESGGVKIFFLPSRTIFQCLQVLTFSVHIPERYRKAVELAVRIAQNNDLRVELVSGYSAGGACAQMFKAILDNLTHAPANHNGETGVAAMKAPMILLDPVVLTPALRNVAREAGLPWYSDPRGLAFTFRNDTRQNATVMSIMQAAGHRSENLLELQLNVTDERLAESSVEVTPCHSDMDLIQDVVKTFAGI